METGIRQGLCNNSLSEWISAEDEYHFSGRPRRCRWGNFEVLLSSRAKVVCNTEHTHESVVRKLGRRDP